MTAPDNFAFDNNQLELLEKISQLSSGSIKPELILEQVLKSVMVGLDVQAGWIHFLDVDTEELRLAACQCFNRELTEAMSSLKTGQDPVNGFISESSLICSDISADARYKFIYSAMPDVRSMVIVPLLLKGEIIGISGLLSSTVGRFNEYDVKMLTIINSCIVNLVDQVYHACKSRTGSTQFASYLGEKQELLNALSHELQTPLTALIASAGLLAEEIEKDKRVSQQRLIQNILHSASSLENRLVELLDISRAQTSHFRVRMKSVNAAILLSEIVQELTPVAAKKNQSIDLEIASSLYIEADEERFEQILNNLLSNAIKFTQDGGKIKITAKSQYSDLIVEVKDNGPGISKDEQRKLFVPYYRIPADRRRYNGLGLGLSITKQLVELHGGKLWVESESGKGSTFIFSIPLDKSKLEI